MPFADAIAPGLQPYKYNGKELDTRNGLSQYDNLTRLYDPVFPHTPAPDPHAENYYSWSPYAWAGNNPIRITDPDGRDWVFRYAGGKYEAYYDRDVRSQKDVYRKYGSDTKTFRLDNGTNIKFYNGKGEMTGDFTFTNDRKENKYGTVTDGNGNKLPDNEITEGSGYRIFGTSDDSVDASTLYQNLFGSSYIGSNNPKTYKNEEDKRTDSYQFKPIGEAEKAAYQHDLDYDRLKATGPMDAFFNKKTGQADRDLANRSKAIMNNPNLPKWDRNRAKAIYGVFNVIATYKGK
jgi:RHS repeat-associated protein